MSSGGDRASAWAGPIDLPGLGDPGDRGGREALLRAFEDELYGPVPSPPEVLTIRRETLAGEGAERIVVTVVEGGRRFEADAALWLPEMPDGPVPLIAGLDFVGPAGILFGDAFPLDDAARVYSRPETGAREGRLDPVLRGTSAWRWPVGMLTARGYAVLVACYGTWTPDDPAEWRNGVADLMGQKAAASGAISLWTWGIERLIDVAELVPEIDASRIAVAGHSRLGKAALWAAARDRRIGAVLANNSGAAGAAPERHRIGETLAQLADRFPHWLRPGYRDGPRDIDQHHLIGLIAPRAVYLASAEADLWADPLGSHAALRAASAAWGDDPEAWPAPDVLWRSSREIARGALGHHIRPGGHDLLPYDWSRFLDFLALQPSFAPPP